MTRLSAKWLVLGIMMCSACASTTTINRLQAQLFTPPPTYTVFKTNEALTIDGALTESAWSKASAVELVNTVTGLPPLARTLAKLLWTDSTLVIGFDCEDEHILTQYNQRDELLWKDDVVEVFLAPGGLDATFGGYIEIEVNARGAVLDLFVLQAKDGLPYPLPYQAYNLNIRAATNTQDKDNAIIIAAKGKRGWTAEIAIPLAELRHAGADALVLPRDGEQWRMNLLRINYDARSTDTSPAQRELTAWSPTGQMKFHVPEAFGNLVFRAKR
jgi:hypothetical protein